MQNFIILSGLLAELAQAIAPPIPSPTDPMVGGVNLRGFTPKPTEAPLNPFELKKRSSSSSAEFLGWFAPDNTCGYVDGLIGGIKTCDLTQICAALEFEGVGTMGCCDTGDTACTWFGNCIGYAGYYSSSLCDVACQNDINTAKCTDIDYPYCYSYMVPGISVGWFSCASTYFSEFVEFDTTFAGENDGRTWSKVYNTATNGLGTSLTGVSTNAFLGGSIAPASSTIGGGSSTSTSTPSHSSKSSTPVGATVGGVVGGLAVIGIAAGVILFFLLRRRNRPNNGPTSTAGVTAVGAPPPEGQAPTMTEQQTTQSVYGAPGGYQPPQQTEGLAASYYGKQDHSPNVQQGGFDAAAAKMYGGPHVSQQEAKPPLSPAPPYSQPVVAAGGISPVNSPPPNVQELNAHMGQPQYAPQQQGMQQPMGGVAAVGGPPRMQRYQQHQQAQELPTQYATTLHTAEGQPIYEAPDQGYRGVQ